MSAIYRNAIAIADKFVPPKLQPLWNHEAGKPFVTRVERMYLSNTTLFDGRGIYSIIT